MSASFWVKKEKVMGKIDVMDFEKGVIRQYHQDDKFLDFLKEKKELILDYTKLGLKELDDGDLESLGEENVIDYLEEISNIDLSENLEGEEFILQNLPVIASIAFNYLREGISYLDVVQEGIVGLIKGIDIYNSEIYGDFENYKKYWIIREIVLFINNKVVATKNEFKSFFKDKRENFGKENPYEEELEDSSEVYLKEEDLLPTLESIDKREKLMERQIDFFKLKNRLSSRQIEVLNCYFGFGKEKRLSIFEIEEKLGIAKGEGELIFEQALFILSTVQGKVIL